MNQISAPNNFVGPREEVYFFSERFLTAVRWENYKLHINAGVWKLYDLGRDQSEIFDISQERPELTRFLSQKIYNYSEKHGVPIK